jgi:GTP cyclohydrolase I
MMRKAAGTNMTWDDVYLRARLIAGVLEEKGITSVWGVPRGGAVVAGILHGMGFEVAPTFVGAGAVVDDIIDSGRTRDDYIKVDRPFLALVDKQGNSYDRALGWVHFPWELEPERDMESGVVRFLQYLGLDVNDESIADTPKRVVKSWSELYAGYSQDPADILARTFPPDSYDEMVILSGIDFHSTCEHHLLPFTGVAHVGYIPADRVVGLSKLARLVDCFARRLQIQERMTVQIADSIESVLNARGVAVVVNAHHSCMGCRGVRKPRGRMITSAVRGLLQEPTARQEFMTLVSGGTE